MKKQEVSPVAVVNAFLDRIANHNDELNAYITILHDEAREVAKEAERVIESGGELGPLHGVPLAIKDINAHKTGVRHTFGAKPFTDFTSDHDSLFVERLENAGAIVLGKTNTPEFGHKGTTDNLLLGPTSTPFDLAKNAGGSSGGSASAVAAGLATIAQGGTVEVQSVFRRRSVVSTELNPRSDGHRWKAVRMRLRYIRRSSMRVQSLEQ